MLGDRRLRISTRFETPPATIQNITEISPGNLTAILGKIVNLRTRLEALSDVIKLSELNPEDKCKMISICRVAKDLSDTRNRILHDLPFGYSPNENSISVIRQETRVHPQVKIKPPKHFTPDSIISIGNEMWEVEKWLGLRFMNVLDDNGAPIIHPTWTDEERFPWRDKYQSLWPQFDPNR